jgi:hypothetical protein
VERRVEKRDPLWERAKGTVRKEGKKEQEKELRRKKERK